MSKVLVNNLPLERPKTVLDLGSGNGSLTIAASQRWSRARIITVDVDHEASEALPMSLQATGFAGGHSHILTDALSLELSGLLPKGRFKPEVAVCNPPFIVPKWKKSFNEILEDVGLSSCIPTIATTDAAILFLAQNLRLLQPNGYLGIIVPDSIISADKYASFRAELLSKYNVMNAIRLSRGSFGGTDALAHILVIRNSSPTGKFVGLSNLDDEGNETGFLKVDLHQAAKRLDYNFHVSEASKSGANILLKDICLDLRRGSLNSAQAKQAGKFVLHTTNLDATNYGQWKDFRSRRFAFPVSASGSVTRAEVGDVIVSRVGRNFAEKVIGVSGGSVVLTDCLYRLRVPSSVREQVLKELCSERGVQWLESHAFGVAARQLTKTDLLNFPLILS